MRKKDITPFDDKGKRHGYWEEYHDNGELWYKGLYIHGEEYGYFVDHENCKINYKEYYIR